jgi:hypothetical protein
MINQLFRLLINRLDRYRLGRRCGLILGSLRTRSRLKLLINRLDRYRLGARSGLGCRGGLKLSRSCRLL